MELTSIPLYLSRGSRKKLGGRLDIEPLRNSNYRQAKGRKTIELLDKTVSWAVCNGCIAAVMLPQVNALIKVNLKKVVFVTTIIIKAYQAQLMWAWSCCWQHLVFNWRFPSGRVLLDVFWGVQRIICFQKCFPTFCLALGQFPNIDWLLLCSIAIFLRLPTSKSDPIF